MDDLINKLNYAEKVQRSLDLIADAYLEHGDNLIVANSLGKDSSVIWHLAKQVNPEIRGFIVTTRYKPKETIKFMWKELETNIRLLIYGSDAEIPDDLPLTEPDKCCEALKVGPTRDALKQMKATAWITGIRATEGHTRTDLSEVEERDKGLIKVNPILLWHEREVWQYLALNQVPVNPLYAKGYRSLGCEPCTRITTGDERSGRWAGTSKCGGECGIHTKPVFGGE